MSIFVIVRHGNTFEAWEPARRIGTKTDLPLTKAGVAQAETLGHHFAEMGIVFDRVLVSPLARTRQTADAIARSLPDLPIPQCTAWLQEIDHGPDENLPEEAVVTRLGSEALEAWDLSGIVPQGWHVDKDARISAWRRLFDEEQSGGGATLLVTSNGAARFALLAAGIAPQGNMKLPTGSYGIIARDADGGLEVLKWGVRP